MGAVRFKGSAATAPAETAECAHAEWDRGWILLSVGCTEPHHPLKYTYDEGLAPPHPRSLHGSQNSHTPFRVLPFLIAYAKVRAQNGSQLPMSGLCFGFCKHAPHHRVGDVLPSHMPL